MNLAVAATTFAVVLPAELPDKTALASLVLGSRYRPLYVFAGVGAAFAVHVALAVTAGSLLGLLPHRLLEIVVALLFALGAVLLLRAHRGGEEEHRELKEHRNRFWPVAVAGFAVIMVAEFGDLTQIVTADLAARYHDPLSVGLGAVLALWTVALLAIVGGRSLLRVVPLVWITRVAAAMMLALAVISAVDAFR